jgi:transcriptional regulator with XRE-family HTH domain
VKVIAPATKLEIARRERGLDAAALAACAEIGAPWYLRIERGQVRPSKRVARLLSFQLGTPLEVLFAEETEGETPCAATLERGCRAASGAAR